MHTFIGIYYMNKMHRNLKLSLLTGFIVGSSIGVAIPILYHVYNRSEKINICILMLLLTKILTVGEERSKYDTGEEKDPGELDWNHKY